MKMPGFDAHGREWLLAWRRFPFAVFVRKADRLTGYRGNAFVEELGFAVFRKYPSAIVLSLDVGFNGPVRDGLLAHKKVVDDEKRVGR